MNIIRTLCLPNSYKLAEIYQYKKHKEKTQ